MTTSRRYNLESDDNRFGDYEQLTSLISGAAGQHNTAELVCPTRVPREHKVSRKMGGNFLRGEAAKGKRDREGVHAGDIAAPCIHVSGIHIKLTYGGSGGLRRRTSRGTSDESDSS